MMTHPVYRVDNAEDECTRECPDCGRVIRALASAMLWALKRHHVEECH